MNTTAKNHRVVKNFSALAAVAVIVLAAVAIFSGCQKAEPPKKSMSMAERIQAEAAAEQLLASSQKRVKEIEDLLGASVDLQLSMKDPEKLRKLEADMEEMRRLLKSANEDVEENREVIRKIRAGELE